MELASVRPTNQQKCFNCHKIGHIVRYCLSRNRFDRRTPGDYNRNRGAPTVQARYNNRQVHALIDTGASVSMIRYDIISNINDNKNKPIHGVLMANGLPCDVIGEIDISLSFDDVSITHRVLVSKNLFLPIILGVDFIYKHCPYIDFHSNKLVIANREIIMKTEKIPQSKNFNNHNIYDDIESLISTCDTNCSVKSHIRNLLKSHVDVFSTGEVDVCKCLDFEHETNTGEANPIKQTYRRHPIHKLRDLKSILDKLLEKNIIRPSKSAWSSPVVLVNKKSGGVRLCVDYRSLNNLTASDAYPIPRIDETLDRLHGVKWFSSFDLSCGYWQIPIIEADKSKTAFSTPLGFFEFNVMPFGLKNAAATFQRAIESIFSEINSNKILIYLDDIVIYSDTEDEHFNALRDILNE
ncbi:Transposon Ty3-G Gag-Pol polyprotein [Thelohanellus kitauei]|uniref:Transposon Ty3-G Gag-Pol polyprotein n=1 Tax=Thelohanellus kitauei TaxID=669202 RepID=A0A0C2NKR1_THEKT|nr:Transposon Ty3-G Gag-Pol polyprotein [Thelohanellus kitauei]